MKDGARYLGALVVVGAAYALGDRLVRAVFDWWEKEEPKDARCPLCGGKGRVDRELLETSLNH